MVRLEEAWESNLESNKASAPHAELFLRRVQGHFGSDEVTGYSLMEAPNAGKSFDHDMVRVRFWLDNVRNIYGEAERRSAIIAIPRHRLCLGDPHRISYRVADILRNDPDTRREGGWEWSTVKDITAYLYTDFDFQPKGYDPHAD